MVKALCVAALSLAVLNPTVRAQEPRVVANSKVFIEPTENGAHTALAAAMRKKKVPLTVVMAADQADYQIAVIGDYKKAGWAKTLMSGGGSRGEANASMTVVDRKTTAVVYAYNVDKGSAARGIQSAMEACAKHLGNHIKGKE